MPYKRFFLIIIIFILPWKGVFAQRKILPPAIFILSLFFFQACFTSIEERRQSYLEWMMATPNVLQWDESFFIIQGDSGNIFVIGGNDNLLIVNTMYGNILWKTLEQYFKKPVSQVIITGSYWEHADGLRTLKRSVDVFIAKEAIHAIKENHQNIWKDIKHHHFHTIDKSSQIFFEGRKITLIPFSPAQSKGNMGVYLPDDHILYTGLLFLETEHIFFAKDTGDIRNWIIILEKLSKIDVEMIIPGRGEPTGFEDLSKFQNYLATALKHTEKSLSEHLSPEETIERLDDPIVNQRADIPILASKEQLIQAIYRQLQSGN